jgi:hypothetical protein
MGKNHFHYTKLPSRIDFYYFTFYHQMDEFKPLKCPLILNKKNNLN